MSIIITLLLVASVVINVWLLRRRPGLGKRSSYSTLLEGIKNIKELATIRQAFQSIVMFEDSKSLLGFSLPGTRRKFILKYAGTIVCGNDLAQVTITERFALNRVRMVVPRSRLLDLYADMKSVQVYDQRAGIFTSIELQDQNREIANNLEEVRQDALQSDILRRADENTRAVLTSLAASLGMIAEVVFDQEEEVLHVSAPTDPELEPSLVSGEIAREIGVESEVLFPEKVNLP
ncbi:MAG: DUF4230 domain-containing protein [Synergistaceae bacterium]|nr:DUF4230 domain-containing protein [Synergistaceae bacterium]